MDMTKARRRTVAIIFVLLAVEFLDEFIFGARESAWPLIRAELHLNYEQIGLLLGIPIVVSTLVEPLLGVLGDIWNRRLIILAGGVFYMLALIGIATGSEFSIMLIALMCAYPASGAFVGLSQSTLMDLEPARHEHNMARWTFVGAIGVLGGSLVLSLFTALALGWRAVFVLDAGIAALLVIAMWRVDSDPAREPDEPQSLRSGLLNALHALQRSDVLRWLILLQFADLLLDVLLGYVTLYFVDVTGVTAAEAAIGVAVWMGASLLGDLVMIPLLERVQGLIWLRLSAVIELILFPAFLLVAGFLPKLILLCLVGLFSSGWYAILQSQLYSALPGQSGTVLALSQIASTIGGGLLPLIIGLAAEHVGIGLAIGIVALAPIALLIGLPRRRDSSSHVLQEASPTFEGD